MGNISRNTFGFEQLGLDQEFMDGTVLFGSTDSVPMVILQLIILVRSDYKPVYEKNY